MTETSVAEAKKVLDYIAAAHTRPLTGRLRAVHNGIALQVEIRYAGSVLPQRAPPASVSLRATHESELDNEEAAAVVGLGTFIRSLTADRKDVGQRKGQVMVRLFYAM